MARKHRHKNGRRDTLRIANSPSVPDQGTVWALPALSINKKLPAIRSQLASVEDRRLWHPDPAPAAKSSRRSNVKLQSWKRPRDTRVTRTKLYGKIPSLLHPPSPRMGRLGHVSYVQFRAPQHVAICVRRKRRREVLLALGRGGGGKKRGRRNVWSNVRC